MLAASCDLLPVEAGQNQTARSAFNTRKTQVFLQTGLPQTKTPICGVS
jgi:hypothetical protein